MTDVLYLNNSVLIVGNTRILVGVGACTCLCLHKPLLRIGTKPLMANKDTCYR